MTDQAATTAEISLPPAQYLDGQAITVISQPTHVFVMRKTENGWHVEVDTNIPRLGAATGADVAPRHPPGEPILTARHPLAVAGFACLAAVVLALFVRLMNL